MKKEYKQDLYNDKSSVTFFISCRGNLQYITQNIYYMFNPINKYNEYKEIQVYLTEKQIFKKMILVCNDRGITYNKWEISASINLLLYLEILKKYKSGYIKNLKLLNK